MKRNTGKMSLRVLFVLIQICLYGVFLSLDLADGNVLLSARIKFSIILICFCYALFTKKGADKGIIFCLRGAMLFTAISDLLILFLDYYFYGVLSFILVQQLYGIRNSIALSIRDPLKQNRYLRNAFILRISIQLITTGLLSFLLTLAGVKPDRLFFASVFYFICILTNVIFSVKAYFGKPCFGNLIFSVGMVLFLLCDINVGIFNMAGFVSVPESVYGVLYAFSSILMWTFYAPSQVLIALSGDDFTVKWYKK